MSSDDEVGYGKPPKQHRFQKGNQMARRRRAGGKEAVFTMSDIVTRAMSQRRRIRRGDRVIEMRVAEVMIERLMQMAMTGSARDIGYVLALIDKHASHLVALPAQQTQITYHRAPGSTVGLPPAHLWDKDEE